jgi:hypothetical protein
MDVLFHHGQTTNVEPDSLLDSGRIFTSRELSRSEPWSERVLSPAIYLTKAAKLFRNHASLSCANDQSQTCHRIVPRDWYPGLH